MIRYPSTTAYCSRDVFTEPPTTVTIVLNGGGRDVVVDAPYKIAEDDVEPTDGWRSRVGKSQLSICFMHSFGKCSGRVAGDPSSCHQIHIRPAALAQLRQQYKHKVRSFFCRTIKAHLQAPLREMLSRIAKKDLTLKYLEYRTQDVEPTAALYRYEEAYRNWLQSNEEGSGIVPFPDAAVEQCTAFAIEGLCPNGDRCDAVHCHVAAAQVRDRAVATALQQLHRPPSFASFVQQQYPPALFTPTGVPPMQAATPPVYVVLLQPDGAMQLPHGTMLASTPPSSNSIPTLLGGSTVGFLPNGSSNGKDPFSQQGGSRAVTPNADLSSAGALTPSHSSGAFDRNPSSAYFTAGVPSEVSFQMLPSQPNSQTMIGQQVGGSSQGSNNDIFLSFRNHFSTTPTTSKSPSTL